MLLKPHRHTITFEENGIPDTISIDRATQVKTMNWCSLTTENIQPMSHIHAAPTELDATFTSQSQHTATRTIEYVVDHMVERRQSPQGALHGVRWYGYSGSDESFK